MIEYALTCTIGAIGTILLADTINKKIPLTATFEAVTAALSIS